MVNLSQFKVYLSTSTVICDNEKTALMVGESVNIFLHLNIDAVDNCRILSRFFSNKGVHINISRFP